MTENLNNSFGFEDELPDIPQDEYTILTPGEYEFTVMNIEYKELESRKLNCIVKTADVQLRFSDGQQEGMGHCNLMFHSKTVWKIREFFASIGQAVEKGQPFRPNWNIIGQTGRCLIKNGSFKSREGDVKRTNEVEKFLEPDDEEPAF